MADAIPLTVHFPVDARGVALAIVASAALIFALNWAQPFLITLLLGILFAYTLNPLVVWLERIRIPRVVGTSLVMLAVICALVFGTYALRGQVQRIIAQLPEAASKVSTGLDKMRSGQRGNMKHVQAAANMIEKAASKADLSAPPKSRTTRVVIDPPTFRLSNFLLVGSKGVLAFIGQAAMLLVTNVLLGLLTWVALYWIGLENAGAWAVAAALLHLIPDAGRPYRRHSRHGGFHAVRRASYGIIGCGCVAGDRDPGWNLGHHLDDR